MSNLLDTSETSCATSGATFLAVQTLCRKMQRDFRELPAEQHIALRDSIIAHVRKFGCAPHPPARSALPPFG